MVYLKKKCNSSTTEIFESCWTANTLVFSYYYYRTVLPLDTSSRETGETDSTLITELLSIQLDMKTYQQDKKQLKWEEQCFDSCRAAKAIISFASVLTKWHVCALRAWQKLRDVLMGWLQTSGKDDRMETKAVCEELQEVGTLLFSLVIILTRGKQNI